MQVYKKIIIAVMNVAVLTSCGIFDDDSKDNRPPRVSLVFPGRNAITDNRNIIIRGTADDADGIRQISIENWTAETSDGFATWQIAYPQVTGGEQYIMILAEDNKGRTDSMAATLFLQGIESNQLIDAVVGQGMPFSQHMVDLAVTSSGEIMVLDLQDQAIIGVDAQWGHRTIIADADTINGNLFNLPGPFAIDTAGSIVIVDLDDLNRYSVYRINPFTKTSEAVSLSSDHPSVALEWPVSMTIGTDNTIYIADYTLAAIIAIDPETGARSIACDGSRSPTFRPNIIVSDPDGSLVVADNNRETLLRIDPETDDRVQIDTLVSLPKFSGIAIKADGTMLISSKQSIGATGWRISSCDREATVEVIISDANSGNGPEPVDHVLCLAIEPRGTLLGMDPHSERRALMRIDPVTGDRVIISKGWFAHTP